MVKITTHIIVLKGETETITTMIRLLLMRDDASDVEIMQKAGEIRDKLNQMTQTHSKRAIKGIYKNVSKEEAWIFPNDIIEILTPQAITKVKPHIRDWIKKFKKIERQISPTNKVIEISIPNSASLDLPIELSSKQLKATMQALECQSK